MSLKSVSASAMARRTVSQGYQPQQISNDIGMSVGMVSRYSRFMDQREAAENNIVLLDEHLERRKMRGENVVDSAAWNN
jgi:hypothetical protein